MTGSDLLTVIERARKKLNVYSTSGSVVEDCLWRLGNELQEYLTEQSPDNIDPDYSKSG